MARPTLKLRRGSGVTHEGGPAARLTDEQRLRRLVSTCLLWESTFYVDGQSVFDQIVEVAGRVAPERVAALAVEARTRLKLRHVPLLLCRELARRRALKPQTLAETVQRADELYEFLALYWEGGKAPLAAAVKKGLGQAMRRFDAYELAKYNRRGPVTLKTVLQMARPRPESQEQEQLWRAILEDRLPPPHTWEVELSRGKDRKEAFEQLLAEGKLGALAFLRNLRLAQRAKVDPALIREAFGTISFARVLPFRFIVAARQAPGWEAQLERAMLAQEPEVKLPGKSVLLVDVSGSMEQRLSGRSDMTCMDGAAGLAIMARELCEEVDAYTFSNRLVRIPARRGMALRDAIVESQEHGGTYLGGAVKELHRIYRKPLDRLIVVTDEQAHDEVGRGCGKRNYMMNVAPYEQGVGFGDWIRISGFSEYVLNFILETEGLTGTAD